MPLAALLALTVLAADAPAAASSPPAPPPHGRAAARAIEIPADTDDDVPAIAPKDDYRFVAWCYGALDEYLQIYQVVKPDLKAIDKLFGTPVVEADPYSADVAEDRKALKRFGAALEAAEKASSRPIAADGEAAKAIGHQMWAQARLAPHRRLADAWLFWGLPARCDHVARSLKSRATLAGQGFAVDLAEPEAPPPAPPPLPRPQPVSNRPAVPTDPNAPIVSAGAPLGPQ